MVRVKVNLASLSSFSMAEGHFLFAFLLMFYAALCDERQRQRQRQRQLTIQLKVSDG